VKFAVFKVHKYFLKHNHRLNGTNAVLKATSLSYENAKNSTSHTIKTFDPIEIKIWRG